MDNPTHSPTYHLGDTIKPSRVSRENPGFSVQVARPDGWGTIIYAPTEAECTAKAEGYLQGVQEATHYLTNPDPRLPQPRRGKDFYAAPRDHGAV